ncbi:MAG: BrnT family toxin [Deltaproteobacteria bacterium]|nr:MAG: BrnT family toxin [Deltaproteobacteria bacterium]
MKLSGIIWLEEIVEKIERKHHVTQDEVREVLRSSSHFRFVEKGHRQGENVYSALGQTNSGRYLIVFFVRKKTRQALPISARDMTRAERRRYEEK